MGVVASSVWWCAAAAAAVADGGDGGGGEDSGGSIVVVRVTWYYGGLRWGGSRRRWRRVDMGIGRLAGNGEGERRGSEEDDVLWTKSVAVENFYKTLVWDSFE
ncbi:hypothetical protein Tco_1572496 [Tanacetum coccineum]